MNKVGTKDLLMVGIRLSLLQSTWFEGGMQSVGLVYCLIPGLKRLYPEEVAYKSALKRYKEPFNTHPFLVGVIAGVLLRLEEEHRDTDEIANFRDNTMGVLAALGDPFFRNALTAFVSVSACLAAMMGGPIAGIVTLLLLFNAAHLAVRYGGVTLGYREGQRVLPRIARWISPSRTAMLKRLSAIFAGFVLVLSVLTFGPAVSGFNWSTVSAVIGCLVISPILTKWRSLQYVVIVGVLTVILLIEVSM